MDLYLYEPAMTPTEQLARDRRNQFISALVGVTSILIILAMIFFALPAWVEKNAVASTNEIATEATLRHRFGALSLQYDRIRASTLAATADEDANIFLRPAMSAQVNAEMDLQQLDDVEGRTAHSALLMQVNKDLENYEMRLRALDKSAVAH